MALTNIEQSITMNEIQTTIGAIMFASYLKKMEEFVEEFVPELDKTNYDENHEYYYYNYYDDCLKILKQLEIVKERLEIVCIEKLIKERKEKIKSATENKTRSYQKKPVDRFVKQDNYT